MNPQSLLDAIGLPEQFGFLLLSLALVLLLAPYLSGSDLGVLKIPKVTESTRRLLRIVGPIAIVAAVLLHVPFIQPTAPEQIATLPVSEPISEPISEHLLPPESGQGPECSISGLVFDSDSGTDRPLSGLSIGLFSDNERTVRPQPLRQGVATTGPNGAFYFECDWVEESQFPVRLSVSHADWVATRIVGPALDRRAEWHSINIPIAMRDIDLLPLREITVSFGSKHRDAEQHVIEGEVGNRSDRSFPCVLVTFQLTRSSGGRSEDAGVHTMEMRDLGPNEVRPYERVLPPDVGFYVLSKSEC